MARTTTCDTFEWMGTRYRILLSAAKTASLGLFESLDPPGYGPPRHVHDDADETFYVLSGDVEFWSAGAVTSHGPGDVVFIPRGQEHTFRTVGSRPARMLTVMTPGGFEGFFIEMARGGYRIPQDMARIVQAGAMFHLRFTGPPLGAD